MRSSVAANPPKLSEATGDAAAEAGVEAAGIVAGDVVCSPGADAGAATLDGDGDGDADASPILPLSSRSISPNFWLYEASSSITGP